MATLREKLSAPDAFVIGAELVTSRGVLEQRSGQALVELAHQLAENPRIDFLSLTDNPGGNPMIAPDMLANRMREVGQEVVLHFACKDMNRNGIESRAWKAASAGLDNILALSGDYPIAGQSGTAAPVFDIDSVGLLQPVERHERWASRSSGRRTGVCWAPTSSWVAWSPTTSCMSAR